MKRIIDLEKDEEVNEAYWIAARGGIAGAARVRIRHTFFVQDPSSILSNHDHSQFKSWSFAIFEYSLMPKRTTCEWLRLV